VTPNLALDRVGPGLLDSLQDAGAKPRRRVVPGIERQHGFDLRVRGSQILGPKQAFSLGQGGGNVTAPLGLQLPGHSLLGGSRDLLCFLKRAQPLRFIDAIDQYREPLFVGLKTSKRDEQLCCVFDVAALDGGERRAEL